MNYSTRCDRPSEILRSKFAEKRVSTALHDVGGFRVFLIDALPCYYYASYTSVPFRTTSDPALPLDLSPYLFLFLLSVTRTSRSDYSFLLCGIQLSDRRVIVTNLNKRLSTRIYHCIRQIIINKSTHCYSSLYLEWTAEGRRTAFSQRVCWMIAAWRISPADETGSGSVL